ncbi:hypothetical protein ES332_A02G024600v1 [Gossypium tomentosum]|uniref:Uncharacterized protein n=1 Tax=Gossypium tomentosum TaxID=34277 RepID=A0A5D2RDL4_GOSTO|nr:hypothetical protein ES332_A02G024600v1 [Gossypium tomentosum]
MGGFGFYLIRLKKTEAESNCKKEDPHSCAQAYFRNKRAKTKEKGYVFLISDFLFFLFFFFDFAFKLQEQEIKRRRGENLPEPLGHTVGCSLRRRSRTLNGWRSLHFRVFLVQKS